MEFGRVYGKRFVKIDLITFAGREYPDIAVLDIDLAQDNVLRVFMVYKAVPEPIEIPKKEFKPFERKGFTVVEWGGTQLEISLKGCDNLEYKEVKWIAIGNRVLYWGNLIFFLLILMASVWGIWLLYEQYGFPNISTIRLYVPLYVSMAYIGVGLTCIRKVMFRVDKFFSVKNIGHVMLFGGIVFPIMTATAFWIVTMRYGYLFLLSWPVVLILGKTILCFADWIITSDKSGRVF